MPKNQVDTMWYLDAKTLLKFKNRESQTSQFHDQTS